MMKFFKEGVQEGLETLNRCYWGNLQLPPKYNLGLLVQSHTFATLYCLSHVSYPHRWTRELLKIEVVEKVVRIFITLLRPFRFFYPSRGFRTILEL